MRCGWSKSRVAAQDQGKGRFTEQSSVLLGAIHFTCACCCCLYKVLSLPPFHLFPIPLANHCLKRGEQIAEIDSKIGEERDCWQTTHSLTHSFSHLFSLVSQATDCCLDSERVFERGGGAEERERVVWLWDFIASQKPINAQPAHSTCYNSLRFTLCILFGSVSFRFVCELIFLGMPFN